MLPNVLQPDATDHIPVLAHELRELLAVRPGETVVDGTFGAGGHSALLAGELPAAGIVNEADERDLATIFKRYGEERYARQIARAIVKRRKERPFERTGDLVDTIRGAMPAPARFGDGHPAKRVFQALRIAVNDELGSLEAALPAAFAMLRPGGRLAVISFHSLEDRLVKRFMRELERGCDCPPDFPVCVCGKEPQLRPLGRKAIRPSARETAANPRSSSARLRVGVKV